MQFHDWCRGGLAGFNLFGFGVDEEGNLNLGATQRLYDGLDALEVTDDIESTFGSYFFA